MKKQKKEEAKSSGNKGNGEGSRYVESIRRIPYKRI